MSEKIKQKLRENHDLLLKENDAEKKLAELYEDSLKVAQASIGSANQTTSVDDRITALANGIQGILDLVLQYRDAVRVKKQELGTKINTIEEVLGLLEENLPTEKKTEE